MQKQKEENDIIVTRLSFSTSYNVMHILLHLPHPFLHQIHPIDELLDSSEKIQVGLGDLLLRRWWRGSVHAVCAMHWDRLLVGWRGLKFRRVW